MSQSARPTTLTSATWTGTAAALADELDTSFLESPVTPTSDQTFLCDLSSLADPQVSTGHQLRVRAVIEPATGVSQHLMLRLENSSNGSLVAVRTHTNVPGTYADEIFALTAAEAEAIIDYGALRVRGYAPGLGSGPAFVWNSVVGATSYVLQVGPSSGNYSTFDGDVGNVWTYTLLLPSGTYYSRVVPQGAGSATDEQTVVVP